MLVIIAQWCRAPVDAPRGAAKQDLEIQLEQTPKT
jgi:hypothetical protein